MPTLGLLEFSRDMEASNRSIGHTRAATTRPPASAVKYNSIFYNKLRLAGAGDRPRRKAILRPREESRQLLESALQLSQIRSAQRHMSHFSPRPQRLSVQMQVRIRNRQHLRRFRHLADQIQHRGNARRRRRTQRQSHHRSQMILKLARRRPFNRPMPRVVHPRRHFIRHKFAVALKKFNRQHAHVIQLFHHAPRRELRRLLQFRAQVRRRRNRKPQNSAAMMILHQRIKRRLARFASHRQNRKLAFERDQIFQQQRCRRKFPLHEFDGLRGSQNPLPFPVVSHPPRLQHRRQTDFPHRLVDFRRTSDFGKRSRRNSQFLEKLFRSQPVLRRFQRFRWRIDAHVLREKSRRFHRHVFKFVSDEFQSVREFLQRIVVLVFRRHALRDSSHRSFRRWIQKTKMQSQRIARQRQHVTQLPAAENPDRHAATSHTVRHHFSLGKRVIFHPMRTRRYYVHPQQPTTVVIPNRAQFAR